MSNNPLLFYRPGLTMDAPITVTMAAADWAVLMAWFVGLDDETENGVKHIVYGIMADQVADALYTPASIQAAKAHHDDRPQNLTGQMFLNLPMPQFPNAEDFGQGTIFEDSTERWVIMCAVCGDKDEYPAKHIGELTCGHDAMRQVTEIRITPKE